jgi:hypothetical protein
MKKRTWWGLLILALLAMLIVYDSLRQPGIAELPGVFEQKAFVRNEQNKGGIVRIYIIQVQEPQKADYEACMDRLPYNEYGSSTTAYFFGPKDSIPLDIQLEAPHFDRQRFPPLAVYIKDENGLIRQIQQNRSHT